MKIGVPSEIFPGERRVALVPASIAPLRKAGAEVLVESGAGESAGFPDAVYQEKGAQIVRSRAEIFAAADVVLHVRTGGALGSHAAADLPAMRPGQVIVE